eukprot:365896-Chlamydomonas_euryale.AAC.12
MEVCRGAVRGLPTHCKPKTKWQSPHRGEQIRSSQQLWNWHRMSRGRRGSSWACRLRTSQHGLASQKRKDKQACIIRHVSETSDGRSCCCQAPPQQEPAAGEGGTGRFRTMVAAWVGGAEE